MKKCVGNDTLPINLLAMQPAIWYQTYNQRLQKLYVTLFWRMGFGSSSVSCQCYCQRQSISTALTSQVTSGKNWNGSGSAVDNFPKEQNKITKFQNAGDTLLCYTVKSQYMALWSIIHHKLNSSGLWLTTVIITAHSISHDQSMCTILYWHKICLLHRQLNGLCWWHLHHAPKAHTPCWPCRR